MGKALPSPVVHRPAYGAPGSYSVVVTDIDGTKLRQLTDQSDVNYAMAWMPDSKHLLYNTPTREGVSLYSMNVEKGESSFMFEANYSGSLAVSSDGKRLAFEERLPLDKFGLLVSDLDGSNCIQLADGDPLQAYSCQGETMSLSESLHERLSIPACRPGYLF
jgi:Tol biopolymer transport system component